MLFNDQEKKLLVASRYEFKRYNGLLGIVIYTSVGVQQGGVGSSFTAFYYDIGNDCELTFEEYMNALGLTKESLHSKVIDTDAFQATPYAEAEDAYMADGILDRESSLVFLKIVPTMEGFDYLDLPCLLSVET